MRAKHVALAIFVVSGCLPLGEVPRTANNSVEITKLAPGRYFMEAEAYPVATAVQWINEKAHKRCIGAGYQGYSIESSNVTNRTSGYNLTTTDYSTVRPQQVNTFHSVNHPGYAATVTCQGSR